MILRQAVLAEILEEVAQRRDVLLRAVVVIRRAAMLSSAAQARIMSTISVLVRRTTTMPRRGTVFDEAVLFEHRDGFADRGAADAEAFGQRALVEHHRLGRRVDVHLENGFLQGLIGLVLEARLRRNPDDCDICLSHDRRRLGCFRAGTTRLLQCGDVFLAEEILRMFLAYQIPECQVALCFRVFCAIVCLDNLNFWHTKCHKTSRPEEANVKFRRMRPARSPGPSANKAVRRVLDAVKADKRTSLTAPEGKLVCDAYGIPVPKEGVAKSAAEAAKIASGMGFPVVMKIVSPDILHKTEAGGVVVGVKTAADAEKAYDTILANAKKYKADAKIEGVQVQQMLAGGTEVIVGSITDGSFGKLVAFGLGGVLVEVLKDITFRLAPATKDDALSMLDGIQAHDMLKGVRGGDPVSRDALADVIVKVSQLVSDFPEIVELDLNPVFATKKDAIAADVRIVVDFDYKPRPAPRSDRRNRHRDEPHHAAEGASP